MAVMRREDQEAQRAGSAVRPPPSSPLHQASCHGWPHYNLLPRFGDITFDGGFTAVRHTLDACNPENKIVV
jgi:hypothetical protein